MAFFLFGERETLDLDLQPDCLGVHGRHKTRPHFCFCRMILVTAFWEYMTRLSALGWSLVEPLSGFAADTIQSTGPSSSSSFLPVLSPLRGLHF